MRMTQDQIHRLFQANSIANHLRDANTELYEMLSEIARHEYLAAVKAGTIPPIDDQDEVSVSF